MIAIEILPGEYAIARLDAADSIPLWATGQFVFTARTADELSVICAAANVPVAVAREAGWRILKLAGPFAFTQTGVLASVLTPLAAAKVSILAVSTFDTDYVLVKNEALMTAHAALEHAGHAIRSLR
jgi:uncharacterized protein